MKTNFNDEDTAKVAEYIYNLAVSKVDRNSIKEIIKNQLDITYLTGKIQGIKEAKVNII